MLDSSNFDKQFEVDVLLIYWLFFALIDVSRAESSVFGSGAAAKRLVGPSTLELLPNHLRFWEVL